MTYDWNEILGWFYEDPEKIEKPTEIIYAEYDNADYDGHADVLFYDNGKFWYVTGSHCSCYGLEDQWSPEEYSIEALKGQVERDCYGFFKDQKELIMAAIEKYESPIVQVAFEYGRVKAELETVKQQLAELETRHDELDAQEAELKDKLKKMLN